MAGKIEYCNRKGQKIAEEKAKILDNWGVRGRDATEMVVVDEEKPLYSQRRDIYRLLKYQGLVQ